MRGSDDFGLPGSDDAWHFGRRLESLRCLTRLGDCVRLGAFSVLRDHDHSGNRDDLGLGVRGRLGLRDDSSVRLDISDGTVCGRLLVGCGVAARCRRTALCRGGLAPS